MLFTSAYILNHARSANEFSLHPFCHSLSNVPNANGATRAITVPDVLPAEVLSEGLMSMAAGDFLHIYEDEGGTARS